MQGTRPDDGVAAVRQQRRDRARAYQAAATVLAASLGGCEVPKEVNPVHIYREVSGINDAARAPLPGLDQPFPNLAVVPPRPERPPLEAREAVSAALAADRAASREPLAPGAAARGAAPWGAAAAPGEPPVPAAPPQRAALAGAPPIPWSPAPPTGRAPAPVPAAPPAASPGRAQPPVPAAATPEAAPAALPEMPAAPPPAPPADLLGPLPSAGPPPLPPPDLLAPARPR